MAKRFNPLAWLKLFRVVNLPTVPGDVLVGVAATTFGKSGGVADPFCVMAACAVGCALYLYGLVDNDIVGASVDKDRPISNGEISLGAASIARSLCLIAAIVLASVFSLPWKVWAVMTALVLSIIVYNRTKFSCLMGICRGLNVLLGMATVLPVANIEYSSIITPLGCVALWTLYITLVTRYSTGEEFDLGKRHRVGLLIGGIIYLQLLALLIFRVIPLLIVGAVLLVLLRLSKRLFTSISAS